MTKVCLVKAIVFPVVMHVCESWTIKEAMCQIIHAFDLWCWRRLLWFPWTSKRSKQAILKEISSEYLLEGSWSSNTLATWCKELTHWKRPWCWERLKAGGERMRWLDDITIAMYMSLSNLWELVDGQGSLACWSSRGHKDRTWLSDWTELTQKSFSGQSPNLGVLFSVSSRWWHSRTTGKYYKREK